MVKAYSALEQQGLLELRHGSGAYVAARLGTRSRAERMRSAQEHVREVVERLQDAGLSDEEIQRLVEAELFYGRQAKV